MTQLVRILGRRPSCRQSPVLLDQDKPHPPSAKSAEEREPSHSRHGDSVPGTIVVAEEVGSIDEGGVRDGSHHGNDYGLLFEGLRADRSRPTEDDGVDTVRPDGKDAHGKVPNPHVERGRRKRKADDGDGFAGGDVPSTFIVLARGEGDGDGKDAGDEVRGAGENEGDDLVEAEGLDDGGEEVLEPIGRAEVSRAKTILTDGGSA